MCMRFLSIAFFSILHFVYFTFFLEVILVGRLVVCRLDSVQGF